MSDNLFIYLILWFVSLIMCGLYWISDTQAIVVVSSIYTYSISKKGLSCNKLLGLLVAKVIKICKDGDQFALNIEHACS